MSVDIFLQDLFESARDDFKGYFKKKTHPKEGTAKEESVELDKFRAKREISCCWCEFVSSLVPCLRRNLPRGFILVIYYVFTKVL